MYLSKQQNVFVSIAKCICLNCLPTPSQTPLRPQLPESACLFTRVSPNNRLTRHISFMESNSDSHAVHLICGCQFQDGQLFSSSNLNIFGLGLIKIAESLVVEDVRLKSNSCLFLFSKIRANVDNVYLWLSNQRNRCCRFGIFCIRPCNGQ